MRQVPEESPLQALPQALGLPVVDVFGKVRHHVADGGVVRDDHEHVVVAVQFLELPHRLGRQRDVAPKRQVVHGIRRGPPAAPLQLLPRAAGAQRQRRALTAVQVARVRRDRVGDGQVLGGPQDARVVAHVAAEQDESVRCCARALGRAREAAQVADGVAGAVEQVKGAVAKVVKGAELANLGDASALKRYLAQVAVASGFLSC